MGDLLPFASKKSRPSSPAQQPASGRKGGMIDVPNNYTKAPGQSAVLTQFLLGDIRDVKGISITQVAGFQAGVSVAFACGGVFIGFEGYGDKKEIIAVPSFRGGDDNWHLLSRIRFYSQVHFGKVHVNGLGAIYFWKYIELLRRFLKVPDDCKLTVRRTPTKGMEAEYERQAKQR